MFELWPVFHHFFSGFPNKPGRLEAGTHLAAATFGIFRCRVLNCGSHGKSDVQFEKKNIYNMYIYNIIYIYIYIYEILV